jgi:molecular chaperone HscB
VTFGVKDLRADYFGFLELSPSLAVDPKDLEKRFYALSRQLHPDLYARRSAAERDYAQEASALLNDAYRALKDPITRAMYVLKLEGFEIGEQGSKDVPPELLEEVFELNMALEELKAGDSDALPQIAAAHAKFEAMRGEIDEELQGLYAAWDQGHSRDTLSEIRALLNRRKYITNLIAKANVPDRV